MKNGKTILIVLVAFTLGYIIRMLVVPKDDAPLETYDPITQDEAQLFVSNYTGEGRYFKLNNELLAILNQLSKTDGDGYALYFGSTLDTSKISNITVAARYVAVGDTFNVIPQFYATNALPGDRGSLCPKNCDLKGVISIKEPAIPKPIPTPVDSVIPDNDETDR